MASTQLTRTATSGTNTKATFSAWVKKADANEQFLFYHFGSSANNFRIRFDPDTIGVQTLSSSSSVMHLNTSAKFRDPSAWYHIVVAIDSTQATDTNRAKIYVNGVQQTSLSATTYPPQNQNMHFNESATVYIGGQAGSNYFNGSMTHLHWIDGTAYDASTFGETDSTSGIWKPKTFPSVTYGTNGFFLKFENSGNMDLDSSGNNLTFATSGNLTQNVDTPSNNFCTWNPLTQNGGTYLNGNTTRTGGDDTGASMGVTNGKWYWEMKKANTTAGNHFGICSTSSGFNNSSLQMLNGESGSVGASIWLSLTGTAATGYGNAAGFSNVNYSGISSVSIANGDIVGCALDISTSSGTLTFYKNGSSLGAATFTYDQKTPVFPFIRNNSGATTDTNFGSGFFGTTAVASANADGNGHGAMEYAVPSGYYTLNTKNLKEFG